MISHKNKSDYFLSLILLLLTLISCHQAGTLGGGVEYKFSCTRGELQTCIDELKISDSSFAVPNKWVQYDNWNEKGYDFLNGVVFHFSNENSSDERLYYITLIKQKLSDTTFTSPSYLAGRSIFLEEKGEPRWKKFDEVSKEERDLANKRIEDLLTKVSRHCNLAPMD